MHEVHAIFNGILETIKALNTTAAHCSEFVTHIGDIGG